MTLPSISQKMLHSSSEHFRNVELGDKDDDLDMDPLTAAAWENVTVTGAGTINWNTAFGVPADAVGVFVKTQQQDNVNDTVFTLRAKITTAGSSFIAQCMVANRNAYDHGLVPIQEDGTSYYNFHGATFTAFILRVVGWVRP